MKRRRIALLTIALLGSVLFLNLRAPAANARDLVIALKDPIKSPDPHFATEPTSFETNLQVFEPLVRRDANNVSQPWLAESWERSDDYTWTFHLRKDVKWHDGSPFTADDVAFTLGRAGNVPNAVVTFISYLREIKSVDVIDPYTIRIVLSVPDPSLFDGLSKLLIVSKKFGEGATTDDYNSGKAMVGTGPYKFVSWVPNDTTILQKNLDYWGKTPQWDKVTYRIMPTDPSRLAALLAGDVDVIEAVPPQDVERLKTNSAISLWGRESTRIAYVDFETADAARKTGKITDMNGGELAQNPFADARVRSAMRLAIDLNGIGTHIYQGQILADGQFIPPIVPGYNPDVKPWVSNIPEAKKLLADAGWSNKFKINLVATSTVFPNAVPVAEALAQSWTQIGIPTTVQSMPYVTYLNARNAGQLPVYVHSFQNSTGSADSIFSLMLHSLDRAKGYGVQNGTHFVNAKLDSVIEQALHTMDDGERAKLYQKAAKMASDDGVTLPLFLLYETTGTKSNLRFAPRLDRNIYPDDIEALPDR